MKNFLSFLLLSFLIVGEVQAIVTSSVSRMTVPEGQTLLLTVSTDRANKGKPDFGSLEKDFIIYSQNYVSSVSIINGQKEEKFNWELILMPKTKGDFTIPAFDIDGEKSSPIALKVIDAEIDTTPATNGNSSSQAKSTEKTVPIYSLKGRINNNNPYVQQQIIYKLSLFESGGLQGSEPSFEDSKDWVIRSLGQPEIKSFEKDGKQLREIIFTYAFFPQKSGALEIPSANFSGYYLTKAKRGLDPLAQLFDDVDIRGDLLSNFDMFATRNPVYLTTHPMKVNVKAIPTDNNGRWWLPAQKVVLEESWEPQTPNFKVGEAVNRSIYLKAEGILETQLPEITFNDVQGMKQYPEKPETKMQVENETIVSVTKISNVYIPTMAGKMTLPELEVEWFNVVNGKYEKATLPAKQIEVMATASGQPNTKDFTQESDETLQERRENIENIIKDATALVESEAKANGRYSAEEIVILIIGAFGLGIVIGYMILKPKHNQCDAPSGNDYKKQIIKAAKAHDLRTLRDAILGWTAQKYGATKVMSFNDVNKLVKDKLFSEELDKITAELYSDNNSNWDAKTFLNLFEKIENKKVNPEKEAKLLPDLYK